MRSSDSLRPEDWVYADRASCSEADQNVLCNRVLDHDQDDVADHSEYLKSYRSCPGPKAFRMDKPAREDESGAAEGVCWHCEQLADC